MCLRKWSLEGVRRGSGKTAPRMRHRKWTLEGHRQECAKNVSQKSVFCKNVSECARMRQNAPECARMCRMRNPLKPFSNDSLLTNFCALHKAKINFLGNNNSLSEN